MLYVGREGVGGRGEGLGFRVVFRVLCCRQRRVGERGEGRGFRV